MKVDLSKLNLALAPECKNISELREVIHPRTLAKIRNVSGYEVRPKTIGKIAKALNCDVTELIQED